MASDKPHLRRDRRLMVTLVAVATLATALLGWRIGFDEPALALPTRHIEAAASGEVQIVFAGDTMLGDEQTTAMGTGRGDEVLSMVAELFEGADEVIINAEAPITPRTDGGDKAAQYSYSMLPTEAAALTRAGVGVLNLGNNHVMDRGRDGLLDTLAWAEEQGLSIVGAGANRAAAEQPLIISTEHGQIAIVSFGENYGPRSRSSASQAGIVYFSPERIIRGMTLAKRAGADFVIAFVHWGESYTPVNDQQRYWAHQLAQGGYDLVIGSGSHTLQTVERVDGVPVVYGMGNLAFGAEGHYERYSAVGLSVVVRLHWKPGSETTLSIDCLQSDNAVTNYVTRVCTPQEQEQAGAIMGPEVTWDGTTGVVTL